MAGGVVAMAIRFFVVFQKAAGAFGVGKPGLGADIR